MKKALLLSFILMLSGCNTSSKEVPLLIYDMEDPYMNQFTEDILAEELTGFTFEDYDAQNSQIIQNEQIDALLSKNPKLMVINPVDRQSVYTMIEKSDQQEVPIIFINREPLNVDMLSSNRVYYIGAPAENSAIIQSELIIDIFGLPTMLSSHDRNNDNIIQLIILKGEQGHQDAEIRTETVIEALEEYGYELDILTIRVCDWNQEKAREAMNELIDGYGNQFEIIISNNDAMALGAIEALSENGYFQDMNLDGSIDREKDVWMPVVGIDGISEAVEMIERGFLYGTVLNDSERMAEAIAELSQALLDGSDIYDISFEITDEKYIWVDYKKYDFHEDGE